MVVMLRQCCCGCTLKTGTIILGVLNALLGLADLIRGIAAISAASNVADEDTRKVVIGVAAVVAVLGAIMLVAAICLLVGAVKGSPGLLVPWMVFTLIFMVFNSISFIITASRLIKAGNATDGTGNIIGAILYILLETYFLLVVYSLYRELKGTAPPNRA